MAAKVAEAVKAAGRKDLLFLDANAISPMAADEIAQTLIPAGVHFVDGGIIGSAARMGKGTIVYVSGPQADRLGPLESFDIPIKVLGPSTNQASAFKVVYAGLTKGLQGLFCELLMGAQRFGLLNELRAQYEESFPGLLDKVSSSIIGLRIHAGRRAEVVTLRAAPEDERVRRAILTPAGLAEVNEMDRRADDVAAAMLTPLTESQRERLVAAMSEVHRLLKAAGAQIERVDPASRVARWCVSQYFAELASRFEEGFDPAQSIPADDADLRPPRGSFLVASADGEPVACGAVKSTAPGVGSLKRMWVATSLRGLGFGRRMLDALESQARELGFYHPSH